MWEYIVVSPCANVNQFTGTKYRYFDGKNKASDFPANLTPPCCYFMAFPSDADHMNEGNLNRNLLAKKEVTSWIMANSNVRKVTLRDAPATF